MRNDSFIELSLDKKRSKIANIINMKTEKSLSRGLISNVVSNLDLDRQLDIKVVDKTTMEELCRNGQYVILNTTGEVEYICNEFVRVEYGEAEVGLVHSVVKCRKSEYLKEESGKVLSSPLFITRVEETIKAVNKDLLDTIKSTLYIYM